MDTRRVSLRRVRRGMLAAAAAVLVGTLVSAAPALAKKGDQSHEKCDQNYTQVGAVETKSCPVTPFRAPSTVSRVCCENNKTGGRRCKPFPYCPGHSPS